MIPFTINNFISFNVLLVSCYVPCDIPTNDDTYWEHYKIWNPDIAPDYVIYRSDFSVGMSRLQSAQTITSDVFYSMDNLVSTHSIDIPGMYPYTRVTWQFNTCNYKPKPYTIKLILGIVHQDMVES